MISPVSSLPHTPLIAEPGHPPASVRFAATKPVPPPKQQERRTPLFDIFLFDPIIHTFAFFSLRPKIISFVTDLIARFSSKYPGDLETKHLHRFNPIKKVGFRSLDLGNDVYLQGYWMPSRKPSSKTVVLGHGYSADHRAMLATAEHLRKQGFNTFLFDFRSHGESDGLRSSIGYHEGKDIAAAVNYVKSFHAKDSEQLFYLGHSMGAAAMMLTPKTLKGFPDALPTDGDVTYADALERLTDQLDGIILDCPYASLETFLTNHVMDVAHKKPINRFLQFLWPDRHLKRLANRFKEHLHDSGTWQVNFGFPMSDMKPASVMTQYAPLVEKPILLIHGTQDEITSFEHGKHIRNQISQKNQDLEFVALEGMNHTSRNWQPLSNGQKYNSSSRGGDAYFNPITAFLKAHSADSEPTG